MSDKLLEAVKKYAEGQVAKHKANVEILLTNPTGLADNPDYLETICKELDAMEKYDSQLDIINKHFTKKDPFKSQ